MVHFGYRNKYVDLFGFYVEINIFHILNKLMCLAGTGAGT